MDRAGIDGPTRDGSGMSRHTTLRALGAIDRRPPGPLKESPSQTAGPYVHIGAMPAAAGIAEAGLGGTPPPGPDMRGGDAAASGPRGEAIALVGTIRDGTGALVRDALVECWQADAGGCFAGTEGADPAFTGFGRSACDPDTGEWRFETIRPGRVPWRDGRMQAPHASLWIVARGINIGLHTRLYFDGDPANADDPLLCAIQPRERAATMIARRDDGAGGGADGPTWRLHIRLQRGPAGEAETVFLDM